MMTTLTITLPHTPRCLSPNAKAPLTQRGAIVAGYKKTAAKSRARNIAWRAARRIWTGPARLWALTTGRWIAPGLSGFTTWDAPDRWKSCLKGGSHETDA